MERSMLDRKLLGGYLQTCETSDCSEVNVLCQNSYQELPARSCTTAALAAWLLAEKYSSSNTVNLHWFPQDPVLFFFANK